MGCADYMTGNGSMRVGFIVAGAASDRLGVRFGTFSSNSYTFSDGGIGRRVRFCLNNRGLNGCSSGVLPSGMPIGNVVIVRSMSHAVGRVGSAFIGNGTGSIRFTVGLPARMITSIGGAGSSLIAYSLPRLRFGFLGYIHRNEGIMVATAFGGVNDGRCRVSTCNGAPAVCSSNNSTCRYSPRAALLNGGH